MVNTMDKIVASLIFRDNDADQCDPSETANIELYSHTDFLVGRKTNARISTHYMPLHSPLISKNHFRIYTIQYEDADGIESMLYCEDLESINGTYVNNILIGRKNKPSKPYLLSDGDVITARPRFSFEFKQPVGNQVEDMDKGQLEEAASFADRYSITNRLLGSGIYGKVYLASDVVTKRQLACKVVDLRGASTTATSKNGTISPSHEQSIGAERLRLIREVGLLAKLNHPNIVSLRKTFRSENFLYIFMELAPGGDLCSFLSANGGHLTDLHARVIMRQVTIAVQYLHSVEIVHRDIKPENILLMNTAVGHRVVLTDFGCAAYTPTAGRMVSMVGTYDYVAPEVGGFDGSYAKGYTMAVDMWSLGIVTLCLLTGNSLASFQEMKSFNQNDIAAKLNQPRSDFEFQNQWQAVTDRAKDFLAKLLILEPAQRMTAEQAAKHNWFDYPSAVAHELGRLYRRSIKEWAPRRVENSIIESIPNKNCIRQTGHPKAWQSPQSLETIRRKSWRTKFTTTSRYFNLDKHTGKHTPTRETQKCKQQIINTLKESGKLFVEGGDVSSYTPPKSRRTFQMKFRKVHATDLFNAEAADNPTTRRACVDSHQVQREEPGYTIECSSHALVQRTSANRSETLLEQPKSTSGCTSYMSVEPAHVDPRDTQFEQPSFPSEESSILSRASDNEREGRKRRRVGRSPPASLFWFENVREVENVNKEMDEDEEGLLTRPDSHTNSSLLADELSQEELSSTGRSSIC